MKFNISHYLFILFLGVLCLNGYAQPGFNKTYNIDQKSTIFLNLIRKDDTSFVLYSLKRNGIPPTFQQGIRLVQIDTLGNIIDTSTYYDPGGRDMLANSNYDIAVEPDGSIVAVGVFEDLQHSNFLIRFNADLSFNSIVEYANANTHFIAPIGLAYKGSSGYYLFGGKVNMSADYQGFIKLIGLDGTLAWDLTYGNNSNNESIQGVFHRADNSALVGKVIMEHTFGSNMIDPESYTSFMTINKQGVVISEWLSPLNTEGGPFNVTRLDNGDLVYSTRRTALETPVKQDFHLMLICRDSNFQLKWETTLSKAPEQYHGSSGFKQSPDGSWYCLGIEPGTDEPFAVYAYKLSADGDSIWRQYIKLPSDFDLSTVLHYQSTGSLVLPSGSFVFSGYVQWQQENGGIINSGWLVKMSPDGCIEWSNCISGVEQLPIEEDNKAMTIAPNPTHGSMEVTLPEPPATAGHWRLHHFSGGMVKQGIWEQGERNKRLDIEGIPGGIYALSVSWPDGRRYWAKVVVLAE